MGSHQGSTHQPHGLRGGLRLLCHGPGATAFRLGLGPDFQPVAALRQLRQLFDSNAFWAQGRSLADLAKMVRHSAVCVTAWRGRTLVGFGRATSDATYRGTIWDLVVDEASMGQGVGSAILDALLASPALSGCERIYLMTTNSAGFYEKKGFQRKSTQHLMCKEHQRSRELRN